MSWSRGISRFAALLAAASVFGCSTPTAGIADPLPTPRVVSGSTGLTLDGRAWWPTGFNAYQLATNWSVNAGCGAMVDLEQYFSSLPPHSMTRFNAFQSLATNKFTGQLDFGPMDAVFAAAEAHDQLVVPVLAPQDGACEGDMFKDREWYIDGWTSAQPGASLSFQQWMSTAVQRWKSSPSLAAWELVGEPETSMCTGGDCSWTARTCPPDAAEVLRSFFDIAGAQVRSLDPGTAITAGLTGGGQCGSQGDEFGYLAASPAVDILQYHDYGADGVALPGDQWNGLARRITQSGEVAKPLLVAEIGQHAGSCGDAQDRADSIDTKIAGQKAAGTAGAVLWAFVPDPRPDQCTYDIGYDDPLWHVVAQHGAF